MTYTAPVLVICSEAVTEFASVEDAKAEMESEWWSCDEDHLICVQGSVPGFWTLSEVVEATA